jgi:hypothetical protein
MMNDVMNMIDDFVSGDINSRMCWLPPIRFRFVL